MEEEKKVWQCQICNVKKKDCFLKHFLGKCLLEDKEVK